MNVLFFKSRAGKLISWVLSGIVVLSMFMTQVQPVGATTSIASIVDPNLVLVDDFQGFGTSLAWWANVVGGWSEPERSEIMNYLFSDSFSKAGQTVQGIDLSSVRYNAGASEEGVTYPVYDPHLPARNGAWIESLQLANGTYDWTLDANQRWVLEQAVQKGVDQVELFGNSPPWWMTYSGIPSGRYTYSQGCQSTNLPGDREDDYADYLAAIANRFANVGINGTGSTKITVKDIEPFNEPSNGWWCLYNNQEGTYMHAAQQDNIIWNLRGDLDAYGLTGVGITATDSNNFWSVYGEFDALNSNSKDILTQANAHGYAGSDPELIRDRADAYGLKLWQSEWGPADWGGYYYSSELDAGLEEAARVTNDLSYVRANNWQYWQAVEDSSRGSGPGYWGLIQAPLDGSSQSYYITKQFYALGQYSKWIRPGMMLIDAGNGKSVAAYDAANSKLVLVTYNDTTDSLAVSFDLSKFTTTNAVAQVWRTSATENLAQLSNINVSGGTLSVTVPSMAVTTLVVTPVVYNAWDVTSESSNDSQGWTYSGSGWSNTTYSGGGQGAYGLWDQDEWASQTTNDYALFRFFGTKVHFYGTKAPSSGKVAFSIDGGAETIVDAYSSVRVDGVKLWSSGTLSAGLHNVKMRITGQSSGGGYWGNVDRAVVENSNWTFCVNDGSTCSFTGNAEVRYVAANGQEKRGIFNASTACNSSVFGTIGSGLTKKCYYRTISSTDGIGIVNLNSHKCMAVSGGDTGDGANVLQWSCTGGNEQYWLLSKVTGGWNLKPKHASTKCLDVSGASTADGADILQWGCGTGSNQKWNFVYVEFGAYDLVPLHSGKCADVSGASTGDGGDIIQWGCTGGNGYHNDWWTVGSSYSAGGGSPTPTPTSTTVPTATPTNTPTPSNSGWVNPASNAAATGGDGDGFGTNPANGYTDNAAYAVDTNSGTTTSTSCSDTGKDRHVFYGYNLSSIPGGSTILGLEVQLQMKVDSTTGSPKSCIELSWDGGTSWTAAQSSSTFSKTEASYTLGGAADSWGHTWTTSELSNLRVRITNVASSTSRDFSMDWIPVRVSYR